MTRVNLIVLSMACLSPGLTASEPPIIPTGLDAYRMWDRWPYQRIGARAYMRSTYDRTGGNRSADASHFLYQLSDDFNVTLDVQGSGILYFARYNHWHGSPWHYEVDGVDHIVQESSTPDPLNPVQGSVFLPEHLFPNPLTWTWATTKGANLMWVPIPFEQSFRMAYSRTRYGTGYYIYHHYLPGTRLSRPIKAWDGKTPPDKDVIDLISRAGENIAPKAGVNGVREESGSFDLSGKVKVAEITQAPSMIRALEFSVPREHAQAFNDVRLRITWDGREHPSVDAPTALFFGTGTFYNRDDKEYLVKGFPIVVRFADKRAHMACYFPMPFFKSALIEVEGANIPGIEWKIRYAPFHDPPNHVGYFHATYKDHPEPEAGQDLVLLDTTKVEGGGGWSGSFVGTTYIFTHNAELSTLEGDPRFFFDDSRTPQAQGTGSEEWGGGGDYWGGRTMTLPFAGHPVGAVNRNEAKCPEDLIHSAYRFLLADLMPFGKNARIQLEHGAVNQSTEHYKTVTYWYGLPSPSLILTDELDIGDPQSEDTHRYESPDASEPYQITSRYELGPDSIRLADGGPFANPQDYADMEFEAEAGTYIIWIRGKNLDGHVDSDAVWLQFDDEIGTNKLGASYVSLYGFGNWKDQFPAGVYAWSSGRPQDKPLTVTFDRSGKHRVRIQVRQGKHFLDQIWLSRTQSVLPQSHGPRESAPGEIVMNVSESAVFGMIEVMPDEEAAVGKALSIDGGYTEIYPAHSERGRVTKGVSEFTVKLRPDNLGLMLRRTLDYAYRNQRAEVFVADEGGSDWQPAGIWYLAGANTCVYSDPPGELGETQHNVVTSNRRFRDDEFLVPRHLTEGKSAVRVRIKFTPVETPLFPGHQPPELGWSEIRYAAYCFVLPEWPSKP